MLFEQETRRSSSCSRLMILRSIPAGILLAALPVAAPARAQSVPSIDTEDATLGASKASGPGPLHLSAGVDLRNGDFARGNYDDDRADLARLPVHVQVGIAMDLARNPDGQATSWIVLRSSNGFHAPSMEERADPRSWYESNNLAAFVFTPVEGLRAAATYTIKSSPNEVSDTTHEASLSFSYRGKDGFGKLSPTFAATIRPKGDSGVFTQFGLAPRFDLADHPDAPSIELPLTLGVGWAGFYDTGSGSRLYGRAGAAIVQPLKLGATSWSARLEAVALIRDDVLARLSGPDGETSAIVPLVTLSLSTTY